ncbi:hypothetical protein FRB97_004733 [Tulasnella sp. 331]|nr:hypothetical protein FRB97_004733 [Tulasnella sp. 331]
MSVQVIAHTIDLTNEPDSPPPRHRRASSESSDVVFVGSYQPPEQQQPIAGPSNPQAHPQPPRMTLGANSENQAGSHSIMMVGSDDDDEPIEDHDLPPPPPPAAFRIFSPPAQFSQSAASGSRAARAAPPIHPPPRIGLGGGLVALRARDPPSRYHSQDAARRSGHSPTYRPRPPRNIFNRFFETFGSLWGGGEEDPDDIGGGDYEGYRHQVELPEFGGMFWDAGGHGARQRAHARVHARAFEAYRVAGAAPGWANSESEPVKSTFSHIMTHRETPRPGFSFDFDPDGTSASAPIVIDEDEPGPSVVKSSRSDTPPPSSTLLCPRCDSTLLLGSRTMWALRCGHVLCDTCIQDISFPTSAKGKEKEKVGVAEGVDIDVKGKGKAKAVEEDVKAGIDDASVIKIELPTPPTKRSRRAAIPPLSSTRQLRSRTAASHDGLPINPTKPAPTSRKRGRLTKPGTIGEEWEYACPVEDCQKSSYAIKVWVVKSGGFVAGAESGDWVWKQKDRTGAIPIFA